MKSSSFTLILSIFGIIQIAQGSPVYKDKNAPLEQRVSDLVGQMSLAEKIQQLNQLSFGINLNPNNKGETVNDVAPEVGSLIYLNEDPVERNAIQRRAMEKSRLGIPILFGFDTIHGIKTVYPIPLAQACSWNPALVTQTAAVAARETKLTGIDWTFSPMIDVSRDPRWGRIAESYGEDPHTAAVFGVATVKGYQGAKLSDPFSVASCLKHFAGYGVSEGGRDYRATDISTQALWETYLPPYEAGVKAGAATLMSGFNDISGVPASANHYLLTEILKQGWNHDGFVVSDWNSVEQLIAQGVAKDRKEAGLKSFKAGVEMNMVDRIYADHLQELLLEDKITMDSINDAVSRVLRVKFRLGLFEQPYTPIVPEADRYLRPEDKIVAAKLAEESMVLLKNERAALPISPKVKSLALIGPLVKDQENLLGCWSGNGKAKDVESIFEGVTREFGDKVKLLYARGCDFDGTDESGFTEAIDAAVKADAVVICIGEKKAWSGENSSRSTIALPAIQEKLVARLKQTGKPIILVLSNGRPLELQRLEPQADAIVEIWHPGVAGGTPLAGILSGRVNPSGRLAITFPLATGQIPIYYGMRSSARPNDGNYKDISTEPLYTFGHGLSYTSFNYGKATLSKGKLASDQMLTVQVPVTNTGSVAGQETAFWFISDPVCSVSRPMKELKHFEKKTIKPGETVVFTFEIDPQRDLSHPDSTGKKLLEAGDFHVRIKDQRLTFELVDNDDRPTVSTPVPPR